MATTYEPIATTTLGSAAASITFSSIAGTYTDLRLVLSLIPATGTRPYYNLIQTQEVIILELCCGVMALLLLLQAVQITLL